jgi:hypothetical protein
MKLVQNQTQLVVDLIFDKEVIYDPENEIHNNLIELNFIRKGAEKDEVDRLFPTSAGVEHVLKDIDLKYFESVNEEDDKQVPDQRPDLILYNAKVIKKVNLGKPYWETLIVGIFSRGNLIGKYYRNYGSFYRTFYPFNYKDVWYALYSCDYTSTRIMKLPDCVDIGGEDRCSFGFCPVEFYVPTNPYTNSSEGFGFVAGCVWGDDTSWKIQFLDLRECDNGVLKRDPRFGYIELPDDCQLRDAVLIDKDWWWDLEDDRKEEQREIDPIEDNRWLTLKVQTHVRLKTGVE